MKLSVVSLLLAITIALAVVIGAAPAKSYGKAIIDVSWPNCGVTPVNYEAGIVGVTGGLDFRPNPCLANESSWFRHLSLYVNTGYPGDTYGKKYKDSPNVCSEKDSRCLAYNYGYNATLYALNYASSQDEHTNLWWLDVETSNSWTSHPLINRASLQGAIDALSRQTFLSTVGFYSSPSQWASITGSWHNNVPAWLATGAIDSRAAALGCTEQSFNGGQIRLSQYTQGLDKNYACSPELRSRNW
jgi:hypothetical protein